MPAWRISSGGADRPGRHPTPLAQAFAEYGRIAKTLHLLAMVDSIDTGYRRTVHHQLTVQESRSPGNGPGQISTEWPRRAKRRAPSDREPGTLPLRAPRRRQSSPPPAQASDPIQRDFRWEETPC
jgi:Tn3 transposase DDE domain